MGIFAGRKADLFTVYEITLTVADKLMGGTPRDPKVIEGWLRAKAGFTQDEEVRRGVAATLRQLGVPDPENATKDEIVAASKELAENRQTNGFKRDATGLYIEDRQLKAMIRESVNILYAGERWGPTRKGPKGFTVERVFINPSPKIHLMRDGKPITEPDGLELFIGHVDGPQGSQSTLTHYEYVNGPSVTFTAAALRDCLDQEHWADILNLAEENGLGSLRSQSFGRFDVTAFRKLDKAEARDFVFARSPLLTATVADVIGVNGTSELHRFADEVMADAPALPVGVK